MPVDGPIKSVDELLLWKPDKELLAKVTRLENCRALRTDTGKYVEPNAAISQVIFCHDMAGNYTEADRSNGPNSVFPAYRFTRWHLIDIFVYFSHHFVTVPPISWINLAHRQGVRVLGTVLFEHLGDDPAYDSIFCTDSPRKLDHCEFAKRLNNLQKLLGFEGWLLNFEIDFPTPQVRDRVMEFVQVLKSLGSEVIWYDAVTWSGKRNYQNGLTAENKPFMLAAQDGLFTNYVWTDELLRKSQIEAANAVTSSKVFIGIDCWGRGCPGDGGWSTNVALEAILEAVIERPQLPLSVALFAPAWPFENCCDEQDPWKAFEATAMGDDKFWSSLEPLIARLRGASQGVHSLHRINIANQLDSCGSEEQGKKLVLFNTNCCSGQGRILPNGALGSDMSKQNIFPTCRVYPRTKVGFEDSESEREDESLIMVTQFVYPEECQGDIRTGTCLRIVARHPEFQVSIPFELFSFQPGTMVPRNATVVSLSVAWMEPGADVGKLTGFLSLIVDYDYAKSDKAVVGSTRELIEAEFDHSESIGPRNWAQLKFKFTSLQTTTTQSTSPDELALHALGLACKSSEETNAHFAKGFLLRHISCEIG